MTEKKKTNGPVSDIGKLMWEFDEDGDLDDLEALIDKHYVGRTEIKRLILKYKGSRDSLTDAGHSILGGMDDRASLQRDRCSSIINDLEEL
jgi:hypothetical protein